MLWLRLNWDQLLKAAKLTSYQHFGTFSYFHFFIFHLTNSQGVLFNTRWEVLFSHWWITYRFLNEVSGACFRCIFEVLGAIMLVHFRLENSGEAMGGTKVGGGHNPPPPPQIKSQVTPVGSFKPWFLQLPVWCALLIHERSLLTRLPVSSSSCPILQPQQLPTAPLT